MMHGQKNIKLSSYCLSLEPQISLSLTIPFDHVLEHCQPT